MTMSQGAITVIIIEIHKIFMDMDNGYRKVGIKWKGRSGKGGNPKRHVSKQVYLSFAFCIRFAFSLFV